jgi:hypothetical protein
VEQLKGTLGFDNSFAISSTGRSGGLGIFWMDNIHLEILPYSQYHIDAIIKEGDNEPWRLTCVYGEAQVSERHKTWSLLKFIKASSPLPWACVGDFNEVLHQSEHVGVQERSRAQIAGFREMVDVCGFTDLGYEGRSWTFEKKVAGGTYCRTRLDRGLANADWCCRFPEASVKHLTAAASDHGPILLQWRSVQRPRKQKRQFRYEQMWETHLDFSNTLADSWRRDGEAISTLELKAKLKGVANHLVQWDRTTFGNVREELRRLHKELERMQQDPQRLGPSYAELKVVERIRELNHREELMWRQRSRVMWLAAGDRNTRFFHLRASKRRKRNRIQRLKKSDGQFTEDESELKSIVSRFYEDLYSSEGMEDMDMVLSTVPVKVTAEMNSKLLEPFSEGEVERI